jgi:hypothetical protein
MWDNIKKEYQSNSFWSEELDWTGSDPQWHTFIEMLINIFVP